MITDVTSKVDLPATPGRGSEPTEPEGKRPPADGPPPAIEQSATRPPDQTTLKQALDEVRQTVQKSASHLQIEFDPDLQRVIVKILNGDSGEVIRQIPAEEVVDLAKKLSDRKGFLLEERA